jgi:outer membrane protein
MKRLAIAILALGFAVSSQATSLKDVYQQALANDPQLAAELALANAKAQSKGLAGAAVMPTLVFDADIGSTSVDGSVSPDVDSSTYRLSLRQTLIAPEAWFSYGAATAASDAAELEARKAEQSLVVRVSDSYFNVLRANSGLASAKATEAAVGRQLEQTQQRFKVGLIAITDVHEAQAQYDSATVELITAETLLDIAYESLAVLTGERYDRILPLKEVIPLIGPMPADRTYWEQKALGQNLDVLISEQNQMGAQRNHKSKISGHLPTVSLVGTHTIAETDQTGSDIETTSTYFGVNVSLPIFSGGSTWAGQKEAYYQRQAAEFGFEASRRGASLNVRNLFRTLEADIARIKAREQATTSAKSAMEATQTGYEVGTRNIVEVLTAQRAVFGAQFNYAAARYDYVINVLKFRRAVGELSVVDIDEVSNWLQN